MCPATTTASSSGGRPPGDPLRQRRLRHDPDGTPFNLDLELTAESAYTPHDASLNVLNGKFAQVNLAQRTRDLKTTIVFVLDGAELPTVTSLARRRLRERVRVLCTTTSEQLHGCRQGERAPGVRLPPEGHQGDAARRRDGLDDGVRLRTRAPTATTKRSSRCPSTRTTRRRCGPESGNAVNSTIAVDTTTKTFSSTAAGDSFDNPTDPTSLTDEQASRGVTFFFRSDDGEVEATFEVTSTTAGCTGRNLLFAGDAAMCTPPPPAPPSPPTPPSTRPAALPSRRPVVAPASAAAQGQHHRRRQYGRW